MVKKEPVSINWQTLFAIIPIIGLWACYRIEKLRLYLIVIIAMLAVEFYITLMIFDEQDFDCFWGLIECEQTPYEPLVMYLETVVSFAISIVLIRKWTREWNSKISKNS